MSPYERLWDRRFKRWTRQSFAAVGWVLAGCLLYWLLGWVFWPPF